MNSDFSDLLRALNAEAAEYLIVGGYAVGKYTEPRYTKDIDVWINTTAENARRVFNALQKFGAPLSGIDASDFTDPEMFLQIGVEPSRIDILMGIDGLDFTECWERRTEAALDDMKIHFISIQDLLANKERVGRPQDLIDAENLRNSLE